MWTARARHSCPVDPDLFESFNLSSRASLVNDAIIDKYISGICNYVRMSFTMPQTISLGQERESDGASPTRNRVIEISTEV